jgi:hypothetical protein
MRRENLVAVVRYGIIETSNLLRMKRLLYIALTFVALTLPSMKCEAQLSLVFKTLNINNLNAETNHKRPPKKFRLGDVVICNEPDVTITITAELINTSDSVIYIEGGLSTGFFDRNLSLYYYEDGFGWSKRPVCDNRNIGRYDGVLVRNSLAPNECHALELRLLLRTSVFQEITPLYYISSIVPTMHLVLCMPGEEAVISDLPENVFLNGVKIEADETAACQNCGELYRLTSNEMIEEYMKENPELFGSNFSDDILRKAFICNMEFARRMYPSSMRPPIPVKNEKETVKRVD